MVCKRIRQSCDGVRAKNNKANLSVVSDDLTERLNAGAIIREISKEIQGGGGGCGLATAGGKNPEGLKDAIEKAKTLYRN